MDVIKTMPAGSPGTLRYQHQWQEQLVTVRYRKDEENQRLLTTIEIIVDHRPLTPALRQQAVLKAKDRKDVALQVQYSETELRTKIKTMGGIWNNRLKLWVLPYGKAKALGLLGRIVKNVRI